MGRYKGAVAFGKPTGLRDLMAIGAYVPEHADAGAALAHPSFREDAPELPYRGLRMLRYASHATPE